MEKQLEAALVEIKNANKKYDDLCREFYMMKLYSKDLEKEIESLKLELKQKSFKNHSTFVDEAKAAMKRYTNKLRKEAEEYAKQKQSKRQ